MNQRFQYKNGVLSPERIQCLEDVPTWTWDARADRWEEGYSHLVDYVRSRGNVSVPVDFITLFGFNLGHWTAIQRRAYRLGRLSADRIARIEELPGWSWDSLNSQKWEEAFKKLVAFQQQHGHLRVPRSYLADGFGLGSWINHQRNAWSQGRLSNERAARLSGLSGWAWGENKRDSF